jgi:superfamily II DNA or RNA helicase
LELEFKDMTEFTGLIDVPDKLIDVELRDYQKEAVEKFMKSKYSIIKLPTAAGKTYLAAEIIRVVGKRTLWIIDKKLLLFQTKQVFEDVLGVPIGTITEGEVNIEDITICTYQTLVKRIDELRDYLRSIGFLIMDECHHSSKSVQKICSRCPNTSYRLGLSATPDLKNDFLEVKSLVGPVCFELSKDNPRLKDFLSDSRLIFVDIDDEKFQPYDDEPYLDRYRKYIVSNDMRNRTILKLVKRHEGKNILIITKLIEHAEILSEMIGCPNLLGKTKKEDRDKIIQRYKEDGGFVCVGSVQVVSEGWDVPTLDILIQASAPSGPVKTIQGLGRILRRYDGKDLAIYYDFMDRYDRVFKSASRRRQHSFVNEGHKIEEEKIEFK